MFFSIVSSGTGFRIVINLLLTIPVILIALTFHETAHAVVAYKMGDERIKENGSITLNPFKKIDVLGFLWMFFLGYGWAKVTQIDSRKFKNPSRGISLCALAGPLANLLLGILGAIGFALISVLEADMISGGKDAMLILVQETKLFLYFFGIINFINATINLIPIPPFDGSKFLSLFLPQKLYRNLIKHDKYTLIAVTFISFLCFRFFKVSPAAFVAEKLFRLIVDPISSLFGSISVL